MAEAQVIRLSELRRGTLFQQYQMLEQIGVGGQGMVWSALDAARGQVVAIKLSEIDTSGQQQIDDRMLGRQAASLVKLRHPNVLPLYEFGLAGQTRYSVSPYEPGGTLRDLLNAGGPPLPVSSILRYAAKTAAALDYLHGQDVVHRDLKPSNILMDLSSGIYLADFGLARVISDTTRAMHTGRGTPPYAPPEQHTMAEMTPQSDIYSFGVMLYELFAGELPWKGEKTLGIEQLYSKVEIPDPSEIDPTLSALLAPVLRRMTAATPSARPRSAGEVMRMLYYVFKMEPEPEAAIEAAQAAAPPAVDAHGLLKIWAPDWEATMGRVPLSLTKFAMVDLEYGATTTDALSGDLPGFLLHNALAYGYRDDFWWTRVVDPLQRLRIGIGLLGAGNDVVSNRVLDHVLHDSGLARLDTPLEENLTGMLMDMAANAKAAGLRLKSLKVLRALLPRATAWQETALGPIRDAELAGLAVEDSRDGDEAASLIGHLRSAEAVQRLLTEADNERRIPALLIIQRAAGGLPASVPAGTRLAVTAEWFAAKLLAQPGVILAGYSLAALGAALGVGLQVFLTYRLPTFMDSVRISVSVERGLMLGAALGLGLFVVRFLIERFPEARVALRVSLAALLGALLMNVAMFIYDVLILGTPPSGGLVTTACLLIALGNAVGSLMHARPARILVCLVSVFGALAGAWWGYLSLAASPFAASPFFYYEFTWTPLQVAAVMLASAVPMAVLPNLIDLSARQPD